jgi:hypothetical protein
LAQRDSSFLGCCGVTQATDCRGAGHAKSDGALRSLEPFPDGLWAWHPSLGKSDRVPFALRVRHRGRFWANVGITTAANFIFAVGVIVIYLLLRFIGFDLLDKLRKLEQIMPS